MVLRQNGIEYVSGGIGEEQVAAMRQMASHYSLNVMVAGRGGEYLSDVDVTIASATGKNVFTARTDGPYLLVRLPAGRYRVTAQSGQASQTRQVTVPAHGTARLDFHLATNES
ncbi:carboxypeptidase-like regulatory domain-containing protein [Trinickia sp.]|uniref:carboxypeptidase-like regulatory domain-containing protein n=1 Tax=Trinickia sp. TaxID=2571163 RepID=UPI003F7FE9C4